MRDPGHRTKVVLRRLPPAIAQQAVMEQIDARSAGRYDWVCFRPGNASQKNNRYSRLYLNFKSQEDVIGFAEFFNGHVFVNEKGVQFKALVEYAPLQQVPKSNIKKDGREGTIIKDPEYLEFLEFIAKPAEHLPSAEIQLERKEAERAAAGKEAPIVTPLMVYVRQQRAAKSMTQKSGSSRFSRKVAGIVTSMSSPFRQGSEKRKTSTSTYVLRDYAKEKPTYILVPRRDEQMLRHKDSLSGGTSESAHVVEVRKDKFILLKGRARADSHSGTFAKHTSSSISRHDLRLEASGRIIKTIFSNKEAYHVVASQTEQEVQINSVEKDKRPLRAPCLHSILKDQIVESADKVYSDEKHSHLRCSVSVGEKIERHARNRDRPDRGVWAPRRSVKPPLSGGTQTSSPELLIQSHFGENFSSQQADVHGERKTDTGNQGGSQGSSVDNGNRHANRRGPHGLEMESSVSSSDQKASKRGSSNYGAHERQVWVQKSGSAS